MKLCGFNVGLDQPLFLIAGPCAIESEQLALDTAHALKDITTRLRIPFIYKSSFDKANRSSINSFRGPGMEEGLRILQKVKDEVGVPVLTDVHEYTDIEAVAEVVDVFLVNVTGVRIELANDAVDGGFEQFATVDLLHIVSLHLIERIGEHAIQLVIFLVRQAGLFRSVGRRATGFGGEEQGGGGKAKRRRDEQGGDSKCHRSLFRKQLAHRKFREL